MKKSGPSFAGRALLAVVLLIGFYALALAIVGVLLYILYAMIVYGNRIDGRAVIGILLVSGTILWSLVPRRDKFVAPGPRIDPDKEPEFFATVQEIADATQQSMPVEIYVDPQINAWVANRGGVMGIGSRRIMGIGLPLLQTLTVDQFRAVLAHEFGHYHGGDTNLGPWIYQTRSVIGRTIQNLAGQGSAMHKPFLWYGNMYLRVTHAISRQQEYAADALAATVVGARHLIDGLKKVNASAMAFDAYWNRSFGPVLNSGHRPPLVSGFATFLSAGHIQEAMEKVTDEMMEATNHSPYDTHPPLPMRIDAVADLPQGDKNDHDPLAITLLNDVVSLEREFFAMIANANNIAPFKEIDWHETGSAVYLPLWSNIADANQQPISGIRFRDIPSLVELSLIHI